MRRWGEEERREDGERRGGEKVCQIRSDHNKSQVLSGCVISLIS